MDCGAVAGCRHPGACWIAVCGAANRRSAAHLAGCLQVGSTPGVWYSSCCSCRLQLAPRYFAAGACHFSNVIFCRETDSEPSCLTALRLVCRHFRAGRSMLARTPAARGSGCSGACCGISSPAGARPAPCSSQQAGVGRCAAAAAAMPARADTAAPGRHQVTHASMQRRIPCFVPPAAAGRWDVHAIAWATADLAGRYLKLRHNITLCVGAGVCQMDV